MVGPVERWKKFGKRETCESCIARPPTIKQENLANVEQDVNLRRTIRQKSTCIRYYSLINWVDCFGMFLDVLGGQFEDFNVNVLPGHQIVKLIDRSEPVANASS